MIKRMFCHAMPTCTLWELEPHTEFYVFRPYRSIRVAARKAFE